MKKLLVLIIIITGIWYFGRDYITSLNIPVINEMTKKSESSVSETDIIELKAEQIYSLVKSGAHEGNMVLLYIYSLDCQLCKLNLEDINRINREYSSEKLGVIAVALDNDKKALAEELDNLYNGPSFKPIMVKDEERVILFNRLRSLGMAYTKPPYIGLLYRESLIINIQPGPGKEDKIRAEIEKIMRR